MRLPYCLVLGRFAALALAVFLLLPRAAQGQAASAPSRVSPSAPRSVPVAERGTYQILTYDIADLLLDVPDYPYPGTASPPMPVIGGAGGMGGPGIAMGGMGMGGGMAGGGGMGMGMGGMGGGMAGGGGMALGAMPGGANMRVATAGSNPTRITVEEIVRTLVMVVAPETWNEQGGATVVPLGTSLVIRQTAAAHQEIEKLLGQLREESSSRKTVAIDARWLLLDSDELDRLAPPSKSAEPPAGPSAIDRAVLAEYTRRPSSLRGLTNCHTGQLVYIVSGTRRNVVSSFIPVVGSIDRPEETNRQFASSRGGARIFLTAGGGAEDDGPQNVGMEHSSRVGYQPIVERPNFGVLLEIRPTLVPRGETATVDVRSTVTVPGRQSTDSGERSARQTLTPTVDRLAIETQELATTLSVPLGQPVLVGGMTHLGPAATPPDAEAAKADAPPVKETPQLYLVLELR